MSTVSSYVKQALALVKGDDQEVLTIKNERKVKTYLKSQISSLENKRVDLEGDQENAEEALANAKYSISDNKIIAVPDAATYLATLKRAEATLESVKDSLADVDTSIAYYTDLLASF